MISVVYDTNIILSGLFFEGRQRDFLKAVLRGHVKLLLSPPIVAETRDVMARQKFKSRRPFQFMTLDELVLRSEMVYPEIFLSVVKGDPDDNRIIECALAGGAQYIVSGDSDLLILGKFDKIVILNSMAFAAILQEAQTS